jgi:hypothetical protein|tara:strand:+ start:2369 stop:2626 length:258 start_codon:yes stop_codon:yes gene_type:complete
VKEIDRTKFDFEEERDYFTRDNELPSWDVVAKQLAKREGKDKPMSRQAVRELYLGVVKKVRLKLQKDPIIQEYLMTTKAGSGKEI